MLTSDFKEFAALLNSNKVEYLVVGGYALAAYGHPRYTGDLDFWVGVDPDNADRLLTALGQFGFGALGIGHWAFARKISHPPTRSSNSAIHRAELGFIAIEDFKINKKTVGRHQDLADLETLERLKGG